MLTERRLDRARWVLWGLTLLAIGIAAGAGRLTASGRTYGHILKEAEGEGGFGYDPLFWSDELQKSFGVASAEEKNAVSHRAKALAALAARCREAGVCRRSSSSRTPTATSPRLKRSPACFPSAT